MRTTIALMLGLVLGCVGMASAEDAAVMLSAKRMLSAKDPTVNWATDFGSYEKDFSSCMVVAIEARNMRSAKTNAVAEVYFIAKAQNGALRWVFDKTSDAIELDASKATRLLKTSKTLAASDRNYAIIGIRNQSGGVMEGYIVRILAGGKLVRIAASSKQLEDIGKDEIKLKDMVKRGEDSERMPGERTMPVRRVL